MGKFILVIWGVRLRGGWLLGWRVRTLFKKYRSKEVNEICENIMVRLFCLLVVVCVYNRR